MEQQLLKILLGLQVVPSSPVESIQSFCHYIFSSEFNVNNISLHLVGVLDFILFFFSKSAGPGSVTIQEQVM